MGYEEVALKIENMLHKTLCSLSPQRNNNFNEVDLHTFNEGNNDEEKKRIERF